jgi:hypothetical protein
MFMIVNVIVIVATFAIKINKITTSFTSTKCLFRLLKAIVENYYQQALQAG